MAVFTIFYYEHLALFFAHEGGVLKFIEDQVFFACAVMDTPVIER